MIILFPLIIIISFSLSGKLPYDKVKRNAIIDKYIKSITSCLTLSSLFIEMKRKKKKRKKSFSEMWFLNLIIPNKDSSPFPHNDRSTHSRVV